MLGSLLPPDLETAYRRYTYGIETAQEPYLVACTGARYTPRVPTTREIADSVKVSEDTIRRWARLGLLPAGRKVHRGRRGVGYVWPPETMAQAQWVKSQLDAGLTPGDVHASLMRGDFTP